ncbi:hypothetical protein ACOSQ4_023243 [Xanthoceras sorbifolium]
MLFWSFFRQYLLDRTGQLLVLLILVQLFPSHTLKSLNEIVKTCPGFHVQNLKDFYNYKVSKKKKKKLQSRTTIFLHGVSGDLPLLLQVPATLDHNSTTISAGVGASKDWWWLLSYYSLSTHLNFCNSNYKHT